MSRHARVRIVVLALLVGGAGVACAHRAGRHVAGSSPRTVAAATVPVVGATFSRPDLGVELVRPAGWVEEPSTDYVLLLRPAGAAVAGAAIASLSLDVPELPFHIPGMIPIGSVRSGYLDDLRRQVGAMTTEDLPVPNVDGATARLVRSSWQSPGGPLLEETALLMVHGDRVYILREQADAASRGVARGAFDEMVKSIQWVKQGK